MLFMALPLWAQVEADLDRPFGEGQVLFLPGTTDYAGDVVHPIEIVNDTSPFHTVAGELSEEVGSLGPEGVSQAGLRILPMGVLFEGIPYPFPSTAILERMPLTGTLEYLNFPSSAWWGPTAAGGAVQIRASEFASKSTGNFSLWGGSGTDWGGEGLFQGPQFSIEGNYQNPVVGASPSGTMSFSSKGRWIGSDSMNVEGGLLATDDFLNEYWYSAFAAINLLGPNFQSLQFKPYFQWAETGNQRVEEVGGYLNYLFNLAGIAQSHVGAGFSHDQSQPGGLEKGFVQTTDFVDGLGIATIDFALRFDFSSEGPAMFSSLVGAQAMDGAFTFMGDFDSGKSALTNENVQQADAGVKCQFQEQWLGKLQYVFEQVGTASFNGARGQLSFEKDGSFLIFASLKLGLDEQVLQAAGGQDYFDTGCTATLGFGENTRVWIKGRGLSGQPFFSEVGMNIRLVKEISGFGSIANLDDRPISWPDPDLSAGRVVWAGLKADF